MEDQSVYADFGFNMVDDCLIVSTSGDLDDTAARRLQREVLQNVSSIGAKKVLIDVSALRAIDVRTFSILKDSADMVAMMGGHAAFVGFQAGVASALVDLDVEVDGISTAINMEEGIALLEVETTARAVADEAAGPAEDESVEAGDERE